MVNNKFEVVSIIATPPTTPWDLRRWNQTLSEDPAYAKYGYRHINFKKINNNDTYEINSETFYQGFVTREAPSPLIEDCL